MRASRQGRWICVSAAVFLVFLLVVAHLRLWLMAQECVMQHKEALGRAIPLAWQQAQGPDALITVPVATPYAVHAKYPYYYTLKLKTGHTFASDKTRNPRQIIAYFAASPRYPCWYVFDVMNLREHEFISLDETYATWSHPREWLKEEKLAF